MKLKLTVCALTILTLVGCGKDICKRSANYAEDCDEEYTDDEMDECHDMLDDCSKDDEKTLHDYFDCMEDAGFMECETTTTDDLDDLEDALDAMMSCFSDLNDLSTECLTGFGGGGSTMTFSTTSSTTSSSTTSR